MRNISKKLCVIAAIVIVVLANTVLSYADSGSYSLKYAKNAPSNVNSLSVSLTLTSSGAACVSVESTEFSTYIAGAAVDAYTTFHGESLHQTINRANRTYTIDYAGDYVPKKMLV